MILFFGQLFVGLQFILYGLEQHVLSKISDPNCPFVP
jgi:hypothetical protein